MCRADMRHWPPHSFRADRQPLGSFEALDMSIGLACAQKSFSGSFDLNQRDHAVRDHIWRVPGGQLT